MLCARSLVGRSSTSTLLLQSAHASGEHAIIAWTPDGTWNVRDLGSKNGTFVNGQRIEPGQTQVLTKGFEVAFGDRDDGWRVIDDGAPGMVALELESRTAIAARDRLLVLPDDANPEKSIYEDPSGRWILEGPGGEVKPIQDQAIVQAGGQSWRINLPREIEGTPQLTVGALFDQTEFELAVSQDEEYVEIRCNCRGQRIVLEPREHGYVLLTLARLRQDDQDSSESERGWCDRDELLRMLRVDKNKFDVMVHRARRQLGAAGIIGAAGIVQVRRGQRRFGTDRFKVTRL